MNPRDRFERTVCDCDECSAHCKACPGMLIPGDIERIAEYRETEVVNVLTHLHASPGAVVMKAGQLYRIPTIVPATLSLGHCAFSEWPWGDPVCTIHDVAPYGCAYFDSHMPRAEGDQRSRAGLVAIMQSEAYRATWQTLWDTGLRSLPPEQKWSAPNAMLSN